MSSSMLAGISGLQANQELLDVVGNNLANANTPGYKSQTANFSDLLYQIQYHALSSSTSSDASAGGADPLQTGQGVQVATIGSDFSQGGLTATGGTLDMAIQGNGFFTLSDGSGDTFSRAGSFGLDNQNYLIDPATGDRVQRFGTVGEGTATAPGFQASGNSDIQIPYGAGIPGEATSSVTLAGNLSANASGPLAQVLTSAQPFTAGGLPVTLSTPLNSLDTNNAPYTSSDSIQLQGTTAGGAAVNATIPLASYFPPGPTMGDLVNAINTNFPGSTASLSSNGDLVVTANSSGTSQLNLTISDPTSQTDGTDWATNGMSVSTVGQAGTQVNTAISIYDSQGTAHTLSLVFQKQANDTWSLTGSLPAADGTVTSAPINNIIFNDNGSFSQAAGGVGNVAMTMNINGLTTPQTVTLSLGSPNSFNGLTQFGGSSSAAATNQNGFASGTLTNVSIAPDGTINGVFSNGQTLPLAQLAIATFANPGGLLRTGDNMFAASSQSGTPLLGSATSGGRGSIQQGSVESSNVDVASEFTQLILAQNAYQMNAKSVTISDDVLQTLSNIIPQG